MLALLLLLHHATARDTPREAHIVTKVASCPDVGYYFTRNSNRNAIEPVCHLCFCQGNDTAVCWQRDIRRCDVKYYHHYGRKRRFSRARRSLGLSDIFFKDAAKDGKWETKDVFDKNTPEECKPYESSYSEGCPPADWCIGCTVCDCNANGRWDCHVLSFCPDGKGKKKIKKRRGKVKKRQASKQIAHTTALKKPKPKTTQKPNRKNPTRKFNKQTVWKNQRRPDDVPVKPKNKDKPRKVIPTAIKSTTSTKKPAPKSKEKLNKKIIKKSKNQPALKIVKRKTKTLNDNEEVVTNITNTIFQKVMATVEKMINESQKSITQAIQQKFLQKRSMMTPYNNEGRKNNKPKPKFKNVKKGPKFMNNNQNLKSNKSRRSKRHIPAMISSKYYSQEANVTNRTNINVTENLTVNHKLDNDTVFVIPIAKMLTKPSYFKYTFGFEMENANYTSKNLNEIRKERFLIVEIAKNASSEVILNTAQKNNCSKDQTENYFPKEFMNMSKVLIMNGEDKWKNITNKLDTNFTLKSNIACAKILSKFKKTFFKSFGVNEMNTTIPIKNKRKKINILKYLNRMFRKVFVTRKINDKSSMKTMRQSNRKHNLIKSIRKKFKSYKVDIKNKINELRAESQKVMKSIRSIEGLLKLLDIDTKKMKENSTIINKDKEFLSNDIEKLHAIIKDEYELYYSHNNLTDTQSVQISYIKQNTKIFMQSLENFAQILNDIVEILTNRRTHHLKVSNDYFRKPKNQAYDKINGNNTVEKKLNKIKELLTNYNLVQNKFMKRLYDVIITLGTKTNQTKNIVMVNKNNNNTDAIEIYTQNIIKNLKKLKNLTQKLSCKNRRKRQAMEDDDVVEYLLILMEYLLNQQKQLIISPANDGIDLLIEAIRTAPDIKTTRKKVLDYSPITIKTETTEALLIANEIIDETNVTTNSKFKTFESIDDDEESNDFYQYNKKFRKSNNIKKAMFETENIKKEDIIYPLTTSSYLTDDIETNAVLHKTKNKDNDKKFKLFIDSTDEDDGLISTTTKSPDESVVRKFVTSSLNRQMSTTLSVKFRDEELVGKDSKDTSQNNKIKLDWIEQSDTQEDERKELLRFIETTTKLLPTRDYKSTTQTRLQVATRSAGNKESKVDKYDDPISSISKETTDEDSKRNKYLSSEHVMYKKQMNLLNSLDYGTEKIENMETDSNEEKSNVEQFPSYYI